MLDALNLGGGLELATSREAGPCGSEISAQLQPLVAAVGKQRVGDSAGYVVAAEGSDWAVHP